VGVGLSSPAAFFCRPALQALHKNPNSCTKSPSGGTVPTRKVGKGGHGHHSPGSDTRHCDASPISRVYTFLCIFCGLLGLKGASMAVSLDDQIRALVYEAVTLAAENAPNRRG
jgi:hypothetical protein